MFGKIDQIYNFFFFAVDDATSDHNTLSYCSGHKTSVPIELWGDDALVLPIQQKDERPKPKKVKIECKKIQLQNRKQINLDQKILFWTIGKRVRDETSDYVQRVNI